MYYLLKYADVGFSSYYSQHGLIDLSFPQNFVKYLKYAHLLFLLIQSYLVNFIIL